MSLSHLISIRDLTREEAILILDTAEKMAATQRHGVKKLPTLQGKTVVNLFFEDSTRTRISFETAAKRLSADVINFQSRGSSVSKGEKITIPGWLAIERTDLATRTGRNPQTGETIQIPAGHGVKLTAGSKLKAAVAKK